MLEIKIILILLLIHYIGFYFNKNKDYVLSCGIFGHLTKSPKSLSIPEVNMLGIYNIDRGKNSCGLTFDGDIYLGLDGDKLYSDFIKRRAINPKSIPIIFGHTRQSSVGAINAFNAHPFGFGSLDNGNFEFIGCHNGTLKNYEELAEKYEISLKEEYQNDWGTTLDRKKGDSEIILEILYKTKSYKVLSEYIGGAALAWTWLEEPNKMYLWSGASKDYEHSKEMTEERPLCVYQRSKNSTFFSSLEDSLYAIGGNKDNSGQIDYNTVYCITDGDFKNAEKLVVTRRNATQTVPYRSTKTTYTTPINLNNYGKKSKPSEYNFTSPSNHKSLDISLNIHDEEHFIPMTMRHGKLYFNKLRYWRNGHLAMGIYAYISGYGFIRLGETIEEADKEIKTNIGVKFINGQFCKLRAASDEKSIIPFKLGCNPEKFYFIQGVMLRTAIDYAITLQKHKNMPATQKSLNYIDFSHISKHPVTDTLRRQCGNQEVYYNGKLFTGIVCPLGSERIYEFIKGNLVNQRTRADISVNIERPNQIMLPIQLPEKTDNRIAYSKETLSGIEKTMIEFEKRQSDRIKEQTDESFIDNLASEQGIIIDAVEKLQELDDIIAEEEDGLIMDLINEELTEPIKSLNLTKKNLQGYLPNPIAKEFINVVDSFNKILTTFIIENKNENE